MPLFCTRIICIAVYERVYKHFENFFQDQSKRNLCFMVITKNATENKQICPLLTNSLLQLSYTLSYSVQHKGKLVVGAFLSGLMRLINQRRHTVSSHRDWGSGRHCNSPGNLENFGFLLFQIFQNGYFWLCQRFDLLFLATPR